MALKIRGECVVIEDTECGVRFEDGFELWCNNEEDARLTRAMTGGDLIERDVYITASRVVGEEN